MSTLDTSCPFHDGIGSSASLDASSTPFDEVVGMASLDLSSTPLEVAATETPGTAESSVTDTADTEELDDDYQQQGQRNPESVTSDNSELSDETNDGATETETYASTPTESIVEAEENNNIAACDANNTNPSQSEHNHEIIDYHADKCHEETRAEPVEVEISNACETINIEEESPVPANMTLALPSSPCPHCKRTLPDLATSASSQPQLTNQFQEDLIEALTSENINVSRLRELVESPLYILEENRLKSVHLVRLYKSIVDRDRNYISIFDPIREAILDENDPSKLKDNKDKAIQLVRGYLDKELIPDFNLDLGNSSRKTNIQVQDREIFILAVIFDLKEIVDIFMLRNQSPIAAALCGGAMLDGLSKKAEGENEYSLGKNYKEQSIEYQKLAVAAIYKCYKYDITNAIHLVIRKLDAWNGGTLLSIADSVQAMDFMATEACQSRLTQIWEGYFYYSATKQWTYSIGFLFPPIVLKERNKLVAHAKYDEISEKRKVLDKYEEDLWYPTAKNSFGKGFHDDRWGCLSPLVFFYHTPRVKLYCHTLAYFVYLALFSYLICITLSPTDEQPLGSLAFVIWIWAFSMMLDEIREMVGHRPQYAKANVASYLSNGWNMIDLATHFWMIVSVILHNTLSATDFYWARGSYAITLCLSFLRIINIFYAASKLGPMVIMIREMTMDLVKFMVIMVVFVIGYGVAVRSLKYPNEAFSGHTLVNIIYEPLWNIFGEMFENDGRLLVGNFDDGCTFNITLHRSDPHKHPRCPEDSWLAVVLFALYMLITNVLLLNLLIAIFTNTYDGIRQRSEKIWKFYRHQLVMEYHEKSALVPPLILISHIIRIIKYVGSKNKENINTPFYRDLKLIGAEKLDNELTRFEQSKMKEVLDDKAIEKTLDKKLDDLNNMVKTVSAKVISDKEELNTKLDEIQNKLKLILKLCNTQNVVN